MTVQSVALVLHKITVNNGDNELSVIAHDVHHTQGQSVLGPGRVFSTRDKQALTEILSNDLNRTLELLQPVCLAASHETLLWYRPRQRTTVCLQGQELAVPLPSLVFLCHQGQLYVMAYRGNRRPTPATRLFVSGLPNIQQALGDWCSGGNRLPEHPAQSHIERIETMFFRSPFTHWGSWSPDDNADITEWFTAMADKKTFPVSVLPSADQTLGQWFSQITRG